MNLLPILSKKKNKNYFVGIDYTVLGNSDLFTFVAAYKEDNIIIVEQQAQIRNEFISHEDSLFNYFVDKLAKFYNTKPLIEIN